MMTTGATEKLLLAAFARTPTCLANFITSEFNVTPLTQQAADSHCVTRSIACLCGNENLYLEAARRKDLRGTCRQEEIATPIPPVYVSCPNCQRYTLLFDPSLHGWRAQMDKDDDADDALRVIKCAPHPGKVVVKCAYRNLQRYEELAKKGISNLEDYFDTFTVLVGSGAGANLKELLVCECG